MAVARERPEAPELRASTGGCVKGGVIISSLNFGIPRFSLSGWISLFFFLFFFAKCLPRCSDRLAWRSSSFRELYRRSERDSRVRLCVPVRTREDESDENQQRNFRLE